MRCSQTHSDFKRKGFRSHFFHHVLYLVSFFLHSAFWSFFFPSKWRFRPTNLRSFTYECMDGPSGLLDRDSRFHSIPPLQLISLIHPKAASIGVYSIIWPRLIVLPDRVRLKVFLNCLKSSLSLSLGMNNNELFNLSIFVNPLWF